MHAATIHGSLIIDAPLASKTYFGSSIAPIARVSPVCIAVPVALASRSVSRSASHIPDSPFERRGASDE